MNYNDLRADIPGTVGQLSKLAQMDVQEEQLEQDFAKLAFMFVADRAQGLMPYILGFEVVEHEPDGSKAVGVFGFKVAKDYYYVPAFFINNQVKGIDMIFSKRSNMFMPLTEGWVDNITERDAIELGDPVDARIPRRDFEQPNFDVIRNPQAGLAFSSKAAEAGYDEFEEGKTLYKSAWDAMCSTTAEMLKKDPSLQEAVAGFVGRIHGKELSKKAEAGDLTRWLSEVGGPAAVSSLFDALESNVKFANAALTVHPNIEGLYVHRFRPTALGCSQKKQAELSIREDVDGSTSDANRQRVLVDGFYIDDKRDPQPLSKAYDFDYGAVFGTPDGQGKYDVLMSDGTSQPCWVLRAIADQENTDPRDVVITEAQGECKMRGVAFGDRIYVKGSRKAETDSLWDTAIPLYQMAEDHTYALIDKSGKNCVIGFHMTGASFTPGENEKINGYLTSSFCKDCSPCSGPRGKLDSDFDMYRNDPYRYRNGRLLPEHRDDEHFRGITLTKNTGKAVKAGDRILIPSNYRALVLDVPWDIKNKRDNGNSRKTRSEEQPEIRLGDITMLKTEMEKQGFHDLTVLKDGPEFYIGLKGFGISKPYGYKQACMSLTGRLGLSVGQAEEILAKAAEDGKCDTHIHLGKAAQFVGASMPMPPEPMPSADPYTGTPMYGPFEVGVTAPLIGAPQVPHGNPYGENLGGEGETQQLAGGAGESADIRGLPGGNAGSAPMDPEAMDLAQQAAHLGQRHVFDMSSIGGLAKVYDTGNLIDSYIPQFLQSLDRLGRVLFLYYWKNEDFGERYGTSETVELEDTLRSVFKQFGDLTLTLRRKAVDVD